MTLERLRFVDGELAGQSMWMERDAPTLDVRLGGPRPGVTRILHYRRSGGVLRFVGETESVSLATEGNQE